MRAENRIAVEEQPPWALAPVEGRVVKEAARWRRFLRQRLVVTALVGTDAILAAVVWSSALMLQMQWGRGPLSEVAAISIAGILVVWLGTRAWLGLYPGLGLDWVEQLRRHTYSVVGTAATSAIFALAFQFGESLSRLLLLAGFLGLLVFAPFVHYAVKAGFMRAGLWGRLVIVVGSKGDGSRIAELLEERWELGYYPIAAYDYTFSPASTPASDPTPLPLDSPHTTLEHLAALSRDSAVDTVVFAMQHTRREQLAPLVSWASTCFPHVVVIPNLTGITNSAVVARDLAGTLGIEIKHNLLNPWARRTKRLLDLSGVFVGALLLCPVLLILAILVRLDSPGPVFYGHKRLGAKGKHFRCWKFRTMHVNADQILDLHLQANPHLQAEWESTYKLRYDPRVTRVGRILRKSSLDELPQLWNVLRGEMSLVGPRPIIDAEVAKYGELYELYERITPGMSGLWQVAGRSDTSYEERVTMDAYYVRNWSVWLDVVILVWTVRVVLQRKGAI